MKEQRIPDYYTIPQAAEALGKSQRQVWRYTRYEEPYALKVTPIGKQFIILAEDLEDFKKRVKDRPDLRGHYERKAK